MNRRELIKTTGLVGVGAALSTGGFVTAAESGSPVSSHALLLPVSFESFVQLESFVRALGDPHARAQLSKNSSLPDAARELVAMVNDQTFVATANSVVAGFDEYVRGLLSDKSFAERGQHLRTYMTSRYPSAVTALVNYAESAYPHYALRVENFRQRVEALRRGARPCSKEPPAEGASGLDGWFEVSFCVMANYLAVVNFGLYTNVVLATFVAAALAVAAVLVIPVA